MKGGAGIVVALLLAGCAQAATEIIIPRPQGDVGSTAPFSTANADSMRYQQVYDASRFVEVSQGCLIRALGFNIRSGNATGVILPNIQINFSTTTGGENSLSGTFADNIGPDDSVAYARGPMTINPGGPGAPGFNVTINLTTPFLYHPALGNLLMDIRYYQGPDGSVAPGPFDASTTSGDGISRVYAFSVGSNTGTSDTIGLVTAFMVDPIPEPGSGSLCLLGLAALVLSGARLGEVKAQQWHKIPAA